MKTTPFLEYIVYDIFGESEPISFRPMMGAHILYYEGKAFAIVEGDQLWFKGSNETKDWYLLHGSKKFSYLKKGKNQEMNYFIVPPEIYEDKIKRDEWLDVALSVAKLKDRN